MNSVDADIYSWMLSGIADNLLFVPEYEPRGADLFRTDVGRQRHCYGVVERVKRMHTVW